MGASCSVDLYLIRHGVTKWNQEKRYLGYTDQELVWEKLVELEPLKRELDELIFHFAFTSDLQRCEKTYHYLFSNSIACLDKRLREIHFGEWEGMTHQQLQDDVHYQAWLEDWERVVPPNGEAYHFFTQRILAFINELLHDMETIQGVSNIALITHGGVIRNIMNYFLPSLTFSNTRINNGQGIRLTLQQNGGDWTCNSWSEVPILGKDDSSVRNTII